MSPRDWDASTYERLSAPMTAMGTDVLDRLILRGDETVLDAGCGTGGVTRLLHERLPHGRVIAVDAAPSMVKEARALLPADVDVRQADLLELALAAPVDAMLSTATFHWVPDHERLFARLRAALKPGGRLVAQCGGHGNVAAIKQAGLELAREAPYAEHFAGWVADWEFATPEDTERRLRAAGFTDVWCWLSRVDVDPGDPAAYLRAICLGSFLAQLPEALREPFVAAAQERLPDPLVIHYVRLNILARAQAVTSISLHTDEDEAEVRVELIRRPGPPQPVVGVVDAGGPAGDVAETLRERGYETLDTITPGVTPQPRTAVHWRPRLTTEAEAIAVAEAVGADDLVRIVKRARTPRPVLETEAPVIVVVGEG